MSHTQVSLFTNDTAQFYAASVVLVFEHLHSHNILYARAHSLPSLPFCNNLNMPSLTAFL